MLGNNMERSGKCSSLFEWIQDSKRKDANLIGDLGHLIGLFFCDIAVLFVQEISTQT